MHCLSFKFPPKHALCEVLMGAEDSGSWYYISKTKSAKKYGCCLPHPSDWQSCFAYLPFRTVFQNFGQYDIFRESSILVGKIPSLCPSHQSCNYWVNNWTI